MRLYSYMKWIKQVVKLNNTAVRALIYKVDQEAHISASTTTTLLTSSIFVFFLLVESKFETDHCYFHST